MTSEIAIMNQRALLFAADSATTVSYVLTNGKRTTRYFKGANKLFQLSAIHPVGLMIYGSASLHGIPWELVIREFRRSLGTDSCATLSAYAARFFEFVRTNTALFPEGLRLSAMTDAAVAAAVESWNKAIAEASRLPLRRKCAALSKIIDGMLAGWRGASVVAPFVASDIAAAITEHAGDVAQQLTEMADGLLAGIDGRLIPQLAEVGLQAAMKRYEEFLGSTGVVIGGYGETEFLPSFAEFECRGFLGAHFLVEQRRARVITRENVAYLESFATDGMINTFRVGIGPETFKSVTRATFNTLHELAARVRDAIKPNARILNLDALINRAAMAHQAEWFGSSVRTHYLPLSRVIETLPIADMAALTRTLIELESLKERVMRGSESVASPIDVAAIGKHDGFVWLDRQTATRSRELRT